MFNKVSENAPVFEAEGPLGTQWHRQELKFCPPEHQIKIADRKKWQTYR